MNSKVNEINITLHRPCQQFSLTLIINGNIDISQPVQDGLHLSYAGSKHLLLNYMYFFENLLRYDNSTESSFSVNKSSDSSSDLSVKIASQDSPLNVLRIKSPDKLILGKLNINYLPNKVDELKDLVCGAIDVLVLTESFIEGYSPPFCLDRNRNGDGLLVYIREDMPCKSPTKYTLPEDIESLFIEINLP